MTNLSSLLVASCWLQVKAIHKSIVIAKLMYRLPAFFNKALASELWNDGKMHCELAAAVDNRIICLGRFFDLVQFIR